ncbi:MAG: FecR domain-containing protein [Deltaproteobacteria bacterium]|nr:FecR domain-containing protein [Deltaproteobacteria bacterium]
MTCAWRDEVLKPEAQQDAALLAHASGCVECSARIGRLHEAYALLSADAPAWTRTDRVRLWARIEEHRERDRGPLAPVLLASLLAAGSLVALTMVGVRAFSHDEKPAALEAVGPVAEASTLEAGARVLPARAKVLLEGVQLEVQRASRVTLPLSSAGRALLLEDGSIELRVSLERPAAFEVITPAARIRAIACELSVDVSASGLRVAVTSGDAQVTVAGELRSLEAGEVLDLPSPLARQDGAHAATSAPTPAGASSSPRAPRSRAETETETETETKTEAGAAAEARAAGARAEPSPPPVPGKAGEVSATPPIAAQVADARALLGRDNLRAAELAAALAVRYPESVEALLVAADAHRRREAWSRADRAYAQAIAHPRAGEFLEEALFRRAEILVKLQRDREALALLSEAKSRATTAFVVPERIALEVTLLLRAHDPARAALALDSVAGATDRVLDQPRRETARALSVAIVAARRRGDVSETQALERALESLR